MSSPCVRVVGMSVVWVPFLAFFPFGSVASGQCTQGDLDVSGNVDPADYVGFVDCVSPPGGGPVGTYCAPVDFDADGDVDLRDFGSFQRVFGVTLGPLFDNREFSVGNRPRSVAVGDLNGDGDLDLVTANYDSGDVSILFNGCLP